MNRINMKVFALAALALLLLSPFAYVASDSTDGFDNYPAQATSPVIPLPWTYNVVTGSSSCWSGISVPALPNTGVVSLPNSDQPSPDAASTSAPNVFEFNFNPTCHNDVTSVNISIQVNSTGPALALTWFDSMISVCTSTTSPSCGMTAAATNNTLVASIATFSLLINGVTEYSKDLSGVPICGCWIPITNTSTGIPVATGSTNIITFQVSTVAYSSGTYSFSFALDTIKFGNSNPIIVNASGCPSACVPAYNVVLQNYVTDQWYNISNYQNSKISIDYNQTTPCTTADLNSTNFLIGTGEPIPNIATQGSICLISSLSYPDIYVPNLAYSSLLSVTVGNTKNATTNEQYKRTIIPCINPLKNYFTPDLNTCGQTFYDNGTSYAGVQRVYLDDPSDIVQYTVTIDDLSGIYSTDGTQIFLYAGSTTNATLITSGYIDGQSTFPTALVPGTYTVILKTCSPTCATGSQYETTLNAGTTSSALTVAIGTINFSVASSINSISIGAGLTCDGTGIIVGYSDAAALTSAVTFTLENYTAGSILVINSTTESVSPGTTNTYFTFTGINDSQGSYYLIEANSTRTNGLDPVLGPAAVTATETGCNTLPSSFPKTPVLPNTVFGLNQILPNPLSAMQLLAFGFIMLISLSMSARTAKLGVIFVVGLSIVFTMAGWLPLQTFYASIFMVGAISVFLLTKSRKGNNY